MMKPAASAGTSLNFDAQALHEQEEAEYQREEQQQQNEVEMMNLNNFPLIVLNVHHQIYMTS